MSIQSKLKHSILKLLQRDKTGSYSTQDNRRKILVLFAKNLVSHGYALRDIHGLQQKHILAVVEYWKKNGLSNSTLKNRTSILRHLCKIMNKSNIVPTNDKLGIEKRKYIPTKNRALNSPDFSKIKNKYIRISLELQRVFGLRREEALKIKPHLADKGDRLELLPSWCKGGRGRVIPIRTDEQHYWLNEAKKLAGRFGCSLIPPGKKYILHRHIYDKQASRAGLKNLHGLRHAYAQHRYKELTGWDAAINGGPALRQLTTEQKKLHFKARYIITEELGHSRQSLTRIYGL